MKWKGVTKRKRAEQEITTEETIDVVAFIEFKNDVYEFSVFDVSLDGKLSYNKNNLKEWTKTLTWAKRKCSECVSNQIEKWTWEKLNK